MHAIVVGLSAHFMRDIMATKVVDQIPKEAFLLYDRRSSLKRK
jgi:hypothetical protein